MEHISSSAAVGGTPVQYGKWTFLDISHTIKESAPLSAGDQDKLTRYDPTPQERKASWNRWFADEVMTRSPLISDAYKEISARADTAINSFLDGSLSEQELSETVQGLLGELSAACEERGYPLPLTGDEMMAQSQADCFYSELRRKLLAAAVDRNNQEGRQYVTGGADFHGDWKYYNSDYYFKSEAGIAALTDGLLQYAEQKGFENFSIRDYGAEKKNLYNNFNTAWSNNFDLSQQYMEDYDQVPPRDFVWFYQTGSGGTDLVAKLVSITHPDGRVEFVGEEEDTGFDPHSFDSATTWAAYRDAQGNLHRVSADFSYNRTESDLRRVSSLLRFSAQDEKVSAFLQNLRVYSRGYFQDYPSKKLDFRV